jgi:hypothetical protein
MYFREQAMHFSGIILEGQQLVAPDAEGDYRISTRRGGMQYWEGSVAVPPDAAIHDGGKYTLRLDDGRQGEIIIGGGPYTGTGVNSFVFKGNGRPPSAATV